MVKLQGYLLVSLLLIKIPTSLFKLKVWSIYADPWSIYTGSITKLIFITIQNKLAIVKSYSHRYDWLCHLATIRANIAKYKKSLSDKANHICENNLYVVKL